jgi:hypothetical protein
MPSCSSKKLLMYKDLQNLCYQLTSHIVLPMYNATCLSVKTLTCLIPFFSKLRFVNGPEVLSKFVGETEKNIRDLFADAENEQKKRGMLPHQGKLCHVFVWITLSVLNFGF